MSTDSTFLSFERAKFKTRLPLRHRYSAGHMWLSEAEPGLWHIGLTRFALRMLGEPVDIDFEAALDAPVEVGQVVGWLEGFKAVSDLYTPLAGRFAGGNPALADGFEALERSAYERGWLFAVRGTPGADVLDVAGYTALLEATIDKMLGQEAVDEETNRGSDA